MIQCSQEYAEAQGRKYDWEVIFRQDMGFVILPGRTGPDLLLFGAKARDWRRQRMLFLGFGHFLYLANYERRGGGG